MMSQRQINNKELLTAVCNIYEIKSMKVAVHSSLKSGMAVGALATIGGLLLGPRGLAVGGIVGGLGASLMMDGSFKSVPEIIMNEASDCQKRDLLAALRALLTAENIMSVAMLMHAVSSGDSSVLYAIKDIVVKFLNNMNYTV